jgi:hypothetical protein
MSAVITLNEQTLGRDSGPVLIMLHGLYGSGSNWRSVAKPFADNYRIILPDLRNHGRSPHHPDMDYRSIARDVIALLDRHAIARRPSLATAWVARSPWRSHSWRPSGYRT